MKKSTLIVLLCALALGAGVYYLDWKKGNEKKPDADTSKPAFSFQASDITSFTIAHPAQPGVAPAATHAAAPVSVLKSGVVEGMAYTLYSDGSIEAQLPQGTLRFGSISALRNHIENTP